LKSFEIAISLNSSYSSIYYYRAGAYENMKDYEKAISDYNKAIELKSNDDTYYYYRGLIYQIIEDYNKAIYMFEKPKPEKKQIIVKKRDKINREINIKNIKKKKNKSKNVKICRSVLYISDSSDSDID